MESEVDRPGMFEATEKSEITAVEAGETFKAIDQTYGSIDNYRRTELALSDRDLVSLKALLLEQ